MQREEAAAEQTLANLAPRFGQSFDGVSVHTGAEGDARAQAHGAEAVTEGSRIFLSSAVAPESPDGQHVMAHEMAHVIQQRDAPAGGGARGAPGDAFEREAHRVADTVAAGGSASPSLRTPHTMAQGYGSPEHQSMGDDVHSILDPIAADAEDPVDVEDPIAGVSVQDAVGGRSRIPMFGGVSDAEMAEQTGYENVGYGASQSGRGLPLGRENVNGIVAVPRLQQMLQADPFQDRARSLKLSLRNYHTEEDVAGAYLAMETDPTTGDAVRYDLPVSPGDMTALNGDLYGSMENMRKAPASEVQTLQSILDDEASWERRIAEGTASESDEPSFDGKWSAATAWRAQPVYDGGVNVGKKGEAAGGDTSSYIDLALDNQAHFGEETQQKNQLEVQVHPGNLPALDAGPQGNSADGNEQAWMNGHARALRLAKESFDLKGAPAAGGVPTPAQTTALGDHYGHETNAPVATGLVSPAAGNALAPPPVDAHGTPLARSKNVVTPESKLNDAYLENAGADHYLTDAFAAGHQIVREVVGDVMDHFVSAQGGRARFIKFVTEQLQDAAQRDSSHLDGQLGDFQSASQSSWWFMRSAARGDGVLNLVKDGMAQTLDQRIPEKMLRAIGAKIVHDYYNTRGLVVSNKLGMTFMIKGDGAADQAPEARQIIALAVLESRNQITEAAGTGAAADPLEVWAYTPDMDKTVFTTDNSYTIIEQCFLDPDRLWALVKDNFSTAPSGGDKHEDSRVQEEMPRRGPYADIGTPPVQSWLERRRAYVLQNGREQGAYAQPGTPVPATADGRALPATPDREYQERQEDERERQHPWRGNRF